MTRLLLMMFMLAVSPLHAAESLRAESLDVAQEMFYNGRYAEAAEVSRVIAAEEGSLAAYELRTAALLFQLRRAIGEPADKDKAFKACEPCAALFATFMREFNEGRSAARLVLTKDPQDPDALFFLGKLDLNYVWLVLGPLGRRTGWNEYWEARRSLDAALAIRPGYLRARVARAWIDYIVDTRTPWGTGWLLGGGNKKKAMAVMRGAVEEQNEGESDFYASAEALFGLWDMQVREKNFTAALDSARRLVVMFPENPEVARFVAARSQ